MKENNTYSDNDLTLEFKNIYTRMRWIDEKFDGMFKKFDLLNERLDQLDEQFRVGFGEVDEEICGILDIIESMKKSAN